MGMVQIDVRGSFPEEIHGVRYFGAIEHGHTHAVTDAITFLVNELLPRAIDLDHKLHEEGELPPNGFRKKGGN